MSVVTTRSNQGTVVFSDFRPHPLLKNPHAQTLAAFIRPTPSFSVRRERLELSDGDFVDLGHGGSERLDAPIVIMVHGLCGGLYSTCVVGLGSILAAHGWRIVILQLRGAGHECNRLAYTYHHGDIRDLLFLSHRFRAHIRDVPIVVVGWSLGASVVLNALAQSRSRAPLPMRLLRLASLFSLA